MGVTGIDEAVAADHANSVADPQLRAMLRAAGGPLNWVVVPPDEAAYAWRELRDWVDWFRVEFAFDHRVVPPCWYMHRPLSNLLGALRDHWYAAYDPSGSVTGPSEWHRALMPLEQRLREWAARTGCTSALHRDDVLAAFPDDADVWSAHVAWDVAERERVARAARS